MDITKLLQSFLALFSFYNLERIYTYFSSLNFTEPSTMLQSKSTKSKKKVKSSSSQKTAQTPLSCLSHVKRSSGNQRPTPPAHWVVGTSVTDRSGSMSSMGDAVVEGVNAFLDQQKEDAEKQNRSNKTFWRHVTFDSEVDVVFPTSGTDSHAEIKDGIVNASDLTPRGCTRLIDTAIEELGKLRKKRTELQRNLPLAAKRLGVKVQAFFTLLTDGQDNESKFLARDLNRLIRVARKEGVVCTFLGANQDAVCAGQAYGFSAGNSLTFSSTPAAFGQGVSSAGIYQALRQTSANIGRAVSGRGGDSVPFSQVQRQSSVPVNSFSNNLNTGSAQLTSTLPPPGFSLRQPANGGIRAPRLTRC